ncbi:MAG: phosphate ABC transporter substrate-binding protein PstS [Nitrospirae bacterium]|nr:phosphate ABC transporter substrate-binding protein PstS [Nitrospirota bacterium]MBF0535455.1 phosphate ABC transporter substrate-binding protein PstS [Nitrospirota bacterium]MBF0617643.1 phosphate ABC transporter substrate-binding protein PstS [Nitrospirota bacterium]
MKKSSMLVVFVVAIAVISFAIYGLNGELGAADLVKLQGAGATFPAPLYTKWFKTYTAAHKDVQIDYQSVGSGSGIKSVIDKTVDFGASDAAMTKEQMSKVNVGVQLLPLTAGSIVLSYNLEGVKELRLPREVYAEIFLGKIKKWNDPKIAAANPGVKLPDAPINVVERSDGSGTTFVFAKHLSAISKEFEKSVGFNTTVNWPVGIRSKGNEGVTASIKTTPGSIGYVEYGYAKTQNMPMAILENKSGNFVVASTASGQATLSTIKLPEDLIVWDSDPSGKEDYPIVTFTWLICYKQYPDKKKAEILHDLIKYCLSEGQKSAEALGYIPLPEVVVQKVTASIDNIK